ncbi:hypothetical protein Tco_1278106 [Tanacetum coccineum]
MHLLIYLDENELLAVIQALGKWRWYLLDSQGIFKNANNRPHAHSLKYLLDSKGIYSTPSQMKSLQMSQPANDEFSQHLSDDEASNQEDASNTGAAPK